MGNRAAVQADETELSFEILLWRERQCNQNPDLGDTHRQSTAYGDAEGAETTVELLRTGDNGQDYSYVLCRLPKPVQQPGQRVGNHPFRGFRSASRIITV